jgi:DNA-binding transcriptional regulator YiaG
MTNSLLRERLGRLGRVQDVSRVVSGSPAVLSLRPFANRDLNPVTATEALARRGLSLLRAKRVVEEMIGSGRVVVKLPKVEDRTALFADLTATGVDARSMDRVPDIKRIREELRLTQEQFAARFCLDLDALQNWERRRRTPDTAVVAYLRVIERLPDAASIAQEDPETAMENRFG